APLSVLNLVAMQNAPALPTEHSNEKEIARALPSGNKHLRRWLPPKGRNRRTAGQLLQNNNIAEMPKHTASILLVISQSDPNRLTYTVCVPALHFIIIK
ncbi:MAG: hypothetical protein SXU28_14385, partial [Pseudomonadota bacterium]|nr:hypothetical protein [Pseudomonadota bacterium]